MIMENTTIQTAPGYADLPVPSDTQPVVAAADVVIPRGTTGCVPTGFTVSAPPGAEVTFAGLTVYTNVVKPGSKPDGSGPFLGMPGNIGPASLLVSNSGASDLVLHRGDAFATINVKPTVYALP